MDEFEGYPIGDLLPALNGRLIHGDPEARFTSFCIDSRFVEEGSLFVPLMGQSRDGHNFIIDSIGKGAVASIVRAGHHQIHEILHWLHERATRYGQQELRSVCIIEVRHTLIALQKIAEWWRQRHHAKVVGITGSVGKTGIKEMLIQMLSRKYVTIGTEKNFNNEIGVPLALSRLAPDTEMAVVEMAMRARGEISLLSRIAHPDIVMISNTSGSHVGRLGSFDEVFRAKCEVVDGLASGGTLMLNRHDPNLPLILEELQRRPGPQDYRIKYFDASAVFERSGLSPFVPPVALPETPLAAVAPEVWVENFQTLGLEGSRFELCTSDQGKVECEIPLLGRGIAENFAAAALLALEAGMELAEIPEAGRGLLPSPQRLQLLEVRPDLLLIDDCYNSSPASVRDSLELLLSAGKEYRKIAVLGDMLELGKFETLLHRQMALTALNLPIDAVVAVGPRMNAVNEVDARDDIELYYVEGNTEPRRDINTGQPQRFGRGPQSAPSPPQELVILDDAAAEKVTSIVLDEIEGHPVPTVVLVKGSRALHLERVVADILDRLGEA